MSNGLWHLFFRDAKSKGLNVVDYTQRAEQEGRVWTSSDTFDNIPAAGKINILIEAIDSDIEYSASVKTTGPFDYNSYEDTTASAGTLVHVFNRIIGYLHPTKFTVKKNVTVGDYGSQRADDFIPGATTGPVKLGGSGGDNIYTRVPKGQKVLLEMVNTDNAAQKAVWIINYVELEGEFPLT